MNEPLCSKCGTETEWKEYLRCPNCYFRLPVVQQLRERIEQLPRRPSGIGSRVEWVLLDDVLAILNSQQQSLAPQKDDDRRVDPDGRVWVRGRRGWRVLGEYDG